MTADLDTSTADWIVEHPETLPLFERHGVEWTCVGKSLAFACREAGIHPAWFLRELDSVIVQPQQPASPSGTLPTPSAESPSDNRSPSGR